MSTEPIGGDELDSGTTKPMRDASTDEDAATRADAGFGFPSFGIDAGVPGGMSRMPPTKVPEGWTCRNDFALDLLCDCGCGSNDEACMPFGCDEAGCTVSACDACWGVDGKRVTCGKEGVLLCEPSRIGADNGVCDCGCGVDDPDCAADGCYAWGCNVSGCDQCVDGSGLWGGCDAPAKWTCNEAARSNGKCDCGCGNLDPECTLRSCTEPGCDARGRAEGCEVCRDAAGKVTACASTLPIWHCANAKRGDGVCDCGCGAADPDCQSEGCSEPGCEDDACERCEDDLGRVVPCAASYVCDVTTYDDGSVCDCGCGSADPDCDDKGCAAASCNDADCDVRHDVTGKAIAPSSWTCAKATYASGGNCDCGCGALDPDCRVAGGGCAAPGCQAPQCDVCNSASGPLPSCLYVCDFASFGQGDGCDCGCGQADPDCNGLGCDTAECYAEACVTCHAGAPAAVSCDPGACPAEVFGDGVCDCGCKQEDPDCAGQTACVSPGCSEPACGRCHDEDGAQQTCSDWYCTLEKQGDGATCDCGCGAVDPDCQQPDGGVTTGCGTPGCFASGCINCRASNHGPMSCVP